jgi:hypothetical protein
MYRRERIGTKLWLAGIRTSIFGTKKAKLRMERRQNEALNRAGR